GLNDYAAGGYESADSVLLTRTQIEQVVDLNGDGWVDLYTRGPAAPTAEGPDRVWLQSATGDPSARVWVEDTSGRFLPPRQFNLGAPCYCGEESPRKLVDVNGDGIVDVLYSGLTNTREVVERGARVSQASFPDLIREHRNGRGGILEFAYASAVAQADAALEQAAELQAAGVGEGDGADVQHYRRVPVVARLTRRGDHVVPATTHYRYARPRFDLAARKALGFRLVETTHPDGSSVDTYSYQHLGRSGRLSKREVFDARGEAISRVQEDWQIVVDPGRVPGSISGVHLGRLAQRVTSTLYGGLEVPSRVTQFAYHPTHGFNFVERILEASGSNVLVTVATPRPADTDAWLVNLVAERQQFEGARSLSREIFTYTPQGRLESLTRDVQVRGAPGTPDAAITTWAYDAYGNVVRQVDTRGDGAPDRVVSFCYDGGDQSGCPSFPGMSDSHSLRVGVRDPVGGTVALERDWASGALLRRRRQNEAGALRDETRFVRDAFGRVLETWYRGPDGETGEVRISSAFYRDAPLDGTPAFVETSRYVGASASAAALTTATYLDGFGNALRTAEETPAGWRGVAVRRDPRARTIRRTHPLACADAACSELTGVEAPAIVQELDALGRVVRITSPDGEIRNEYLAVTWTQPAGPGTGTLFDAVRTTHANGRVIQRLMDGERVVRSDECRDAACTSADSTFYTYEASGELSAIYDAVALASNDFDDPSHALRYRYDSLGRIVQTDDPDAGTASVAYDHLGKPVRTTNARGQTTRFAYDALDRLSFIDRPEGVGEWDLAFVYDPVHRRRSRATAPQSDYADAWHYDAYGRVERQVRTYRGTTLVMDFEHDLLGRLTKVYYPNQGSSATYAYEGAYLDRVCRGDDSCASAPERSWISDVVYDALGRRSRTVTPDGTLAHDYYDMTDSSAGRSVGALERLALIAGDAAGGLDFTYRYDPAGKLAAVADASTRGWDASAAYTYDSAGRLDSWTDASGVTKYYAYDALGNLVGHGLDSPADPPNQAYDAESPRRITRNRSGDTYAYDADGNVVRRGATHLLYDSANRLICVGAAEGDCSHAEYRYDADGALLYESAFPRILIGEFFDWRPETRLAISNVFAFGEKIGYERRSLATLRSVWLPAAWPLPPMHCVWGAVALAGLVLLARLGAGEMLREHPATAALALALVALLLAPPPVGARARGRSKIAQRLFFRDHLGSLVLVTDPRGTGQWRHLYEPFGKPVVEATGWTEFAGKRRHAPADLYNFGARWYDAEAGRFASVDPVVAEPASPPCLNGYSYVLNDPVNRIDPTGMVPRDFASEAIVVKATRPPPLSLPISFHSGTGTLTAHRVGSGGSASSPSATAAASAEASPGFQGEAAPEAEFPGDEEGAAPEASPLWRDIARVFGAIGSGIRGFGAALADDVGATFTGLAANAYGLSKGLLTALYGGALMNAQIIGRGLRELGWSLIPRYGFFAGPLWGRPTGLGYPPFDNPIDRGAFRHDRVATQPGADRQFLRDVWSSHALGPYGQLYRLGVTLVFGAGIALGRDD
ncbi:MAG TPA: RHS repeat-associated core domain-containing protein, partial [Myxococcota bacterium]